MKKTSEDFVRSLREKINDKRNEDIIQRNVLHNALDYFSSVLCKDQKIDIKNVKKYKNRDLKSSIKIYSEQENIFEHISNLLTSEKLEFNSSKIGDKIIIFVINFGNSLVTSPKKNNWVVVEINILGKYTFDIDVYLKISDMLYSIYEKKYFGIKIWLCDHLNILSYEIPLIDCKRDKSGIKRILDEIYSAKISFDSIGEVNGIKISKKNGAKIKKLL
jgi:hypothetical protein